MFAVVKSIIPGSPAAETIITPGDILLKINGHEINDIIDYRYHSAASRLLLEFDGADDKRKIAAVRKRHDADLGLEFETYLMDKQRSCMNKCIFCFIDQLPKGMRETLYYKDDDVRLSFLQGNYVTLTNLRRSDIERIIKLRISPINVSVHTLDPELRSTMLGNQNGLLGVKRLAILAKAGIMLNCQIVCCPGINDGMELDRTMRRLMKLGRSIHSVSIVPVGLTKHRQGLTPLRPFDCRLALKTIMQTERFGRKCLKERGSRVFYCADELYLTAGLKLPPHGYYENYPQLENGVGMMRLFITEFEARCSQLERDRDSGKLCKSAGSGEPFSVVTGEAAAKFLAVLLRKAQKRFDNISGKVYAIHNDFFGNSVTVSGLVTGRDILKQLKGKKLGSRLLIAQNMLRSGDDVFLDDMTVSRLSESLGVQIEVVKQNGADLLNAFLGG